MAHFRIKFLENGKFEGLLGVLSDKDGEAHFSVDDIANILKDGRQLKFTVSLVEEILIDVFGLRGNIFVTPLPKLLELLRSLQTPRARKLLKFLEYGHVRDVHTPDGTHLIVSCEEWEGTQFPSWLHEFKLNYGPQK